MSYRLPLVTHRFMVSFEELHHKFPQSVYARLIDLYTDLASLLTEVAHIACYYYDVIDPSVPMDRFNRGHHIVDICAGSIEGLSDLLSDQDDSIVLAQAMQVMVEHFIDIMGSYIQEWNDVNTIPFVTIHSINSPYGNSLPLEVTIEVSFEYANDEIQDYNGYRVTY